MLRPWTVVGAGLVTVALLLFSILPERAQHVYEDPIDALSVAVPQGFDAVRLQVRTIDGWQPWREVWVDDEHDPALRESELVMFPSGVIALRTDPPLPESAVKVIRVTQERKSRRVVSTGGVGRHIYARSEWGADENLLYVTQQSSSTSSMNVAGPDDTVTLSTSQQQRIADCEEKQRKFPEEFQTSPTVTTEQNGKTLRWPHRYSSKIRLITVHHTAAEVGQDKRSGEERMRALYQYHAKNRGWGDIGYHYVIDEEGNIYQGKSGGDYVVGGHAYCNNVGTIGIALMGNFSVQQPTVRQTNALQWLTDLLATRYRLNPEGQVVFHGKRLTTVLGHRDLMATDCPGETLYAGLRQIRTNVGRGDLNGTVEYPLPTVVTQASSRRSSRSSRGSVRVPGVASLSEGFAAVGSTQIEARPGADVLLPILYRAGSKSIGKSTQLGGTIVADPKLQIEQEIDGRFVRARRLVSPVALAPNSAVLIRIRIRVPLERRAWQIGIGPLRYTLSAEGRVARVPQVITPYSDTQVIAALAPQPRSAASSTSRSSARSFSSATASVPAQAAAIRIKLTGWSPDLVQVQSTGQLAVGELRFGERATLRVRGQRCELMAANGEHVESERLRLVGSDGEPVTLRSGSRADRYRGIIECRVQNGTLLLINELPLEDYMLGLAEQPDSEPYEKQRAFAITGRTYALWYMDPANRKFPNQPYDGSDSPEEFQKYVGARFEPSNPRWLQAVRSTAQQVITYRGQLIKPPYFSVSNGRTLSPAEAGWRSFPFAEIFRSKPDPWCQGRTQWGHGVGMSGCGAEAQANEGKSAEDILQYYYPGTAIERR